MKLQKTFDGVLARKYLVYKNNVSKIKVYENFYKIVLIFNKLIRIYRNKHTQRYCFILFIFIQDTTINFDLNKFSFLKGQYF